MISGFLIIAVLLFSAHLYFQKGYILSGVAEEAIHGRCLEKAH